MVNSNCIGCNEVNKCENQPELSAKLKCKLRSFEGYTYLLHGRCRFGGLGCILDSGTAAAGDTVGEAEEPVLELIERRSLPWEWVVRFFWR